MRGAEAQMLLRRCGGRGAVITGTFRLEAGQQLRVLCGGMSAQTPQGSSGGGGGTFVLVAGEELPLLAAGGGGGTRCAPPPVPALPPGPCEARPARGAKLVLPAAGGDQCERAGSRTLREVHS